MHFSEKRTCNECQIINKVNYKLVKVVIQRNSANKCMHDLKKTVRVVLVCFPD